MPAIALPVSLIASFLGIYLFGLSINIFVLLSFILAIGIITDDSVIMTDAIYRRIENGESPLDAAYKGSRQITFAIIATTLILVAVFLPLIFIEGIAGTLFKETAIALSFAIVVSSFVALTLSPMLGCKFLSNIIKEVLPYIIGNDDGRIKRATITKDGNFLNNYKYLMNYIYWNYYIYYYILD